MLLFRLRRPGRYHLREAAGPKRVKILAIEPRCGLNLVGKVKRVPSVADFNIIGWLRSRGLALLCP